MRVYSSDRVALALPSGHRFPAGKYLRLRERVAAELPHLSLCDAAEASEGELALVHAPDYVERVLHGRLSAAELREIGFPWSVAMVQRSRRSVGATIAAARAALSDGVSAQLGGGTHHAQADKGSGYCVFNDVAVAARLMQAEWHRRHRSGLQVLVVDLDVHQGNGTAAIFRDDPSVFTLSLHGARNFPFRKEPSDLDVDLPDGCGDEAYLQALDDAISQVWQRIGEAPELAFVLAGADPHEGDRLGRLRLSFDGLRRRDARVLDELWRRRVPAALTMAGGYGRDIEDTVRVHLQTLELAHQSWRRWQAGELRADSTGAAS